MTDIMDSQAVKAAAAASAANAAQPSAHQPLRTAVVKAAELARAAEERARDKQHAKGKNAKGCEEHTELGAATERRALCATVMRRLLRSGSRSRTMIRFHQSRTSFQDTPPTLYDIFCKLTRPSASESAKYKFTIAS